MGGGVCGKEKGGLGLRKITILNKALLGKWIWRFACAKEELWKKVLEAKYGKEEFGGGQGRQTGRLCAVPRLPEPFSMAAHRNVTVEECWDQNTGQGGWILGLLRDLNDWEVGLVGNILAVLRDYSVTMEDDAVCWKKGETGCLKSSMRIMCWQTLMGWISLIAMFGWAKSQPKLPFLLGKLLGGKSSRWIGCKEEGGIYLIDVFCAVGLSKFCKGGP
ncbi:hypothetical protein CK203_000203 [Vitis vinifera]|uniref:Uncharacterized protein n=1 Tax=Vitis vinifera TaxID=29760 RepID=A0A438KPK1_VITVI|nr:hypothetical protein CK203_000203 [Vitis vinifera]